MLPTKEQIQIAYTSAPDYVQDFITSEELDEAFTEIRTGHKLHLDDAGRLSLAINAVILEISSLEKFPQLVQEALTDVSADIRSAVVTAVNKKIFEELREWARLDKEGLLYEEEKEEIDTSARAAERFHTIESSIDELEVENNKDAPEKTIEAGAKEVPAQQPAAENTPETESKKPYPGSDPYREPID